jgi:large subunit ribosomal protein L22
MEVKAVSRNVRMSPEKARHVARLIVGKTISEAIAIADLCPRKAARLFGKTLRSALANAENNFDLSAEDLTVKAATADPGPMMKRYRPKARGSAGRIRKRMSSLNVVLTDEQ